VKYIIKKVAAIVILALVLSLSVAGCTSTTNNTAANPTSTPSTSDMASSLTTYFGSTKNELIVTPFAQTTIDNHTAYVGSFKDSNETLYPKIHNYTVIVANDNTDAKTLFAVQVNKSKSAGYIENPPTLATQWRGYYESTTSDANGLVYVTVCQPNSCYVSFSNEFAHSDPSHFIVSIEKTNNAE
jgi:hypothetical protein